MHNHLLINQQLLPGDRTATIRVKDQRVYLRKGLLFKLTLKTEAALVFALITIFEIETFPRDVVFRSKSSLKF